MENSMGNTTITKPAINSITITGGIVGFLVLIVRLFGFDLDEGIITELVLGVIGLISVIRVIIGRVKARTQISGILS